MQSKIDMKVKIVQKKPVLRFIIEGNTAFANALRRIMISEIPTLAVDRVDFHENNSILFDEIIAHRIGLIPLKCNPEKFTPQDMCKCGGKGCANCQVVLMLKKTGPCIVYSGDFKSSNIDVQPIDPKFPIVELLPNQSLKLEAVAILGTGKEHMKYQTANASYQYYPEVEVKGDVSRMKSKIERACPKGIIKVTGNKASITKPEECDLCLSCEEASDGNLKLVGNPSKQIFMVESVSGLEPEYIVKKAAEILGEKGKEFLKELGKI